MSKEVMESGEFMEGYEEPQKERSESKLERLIRGCRRETGS